MHYHTQLYITLFPFSLSPHLKSVNTFCSNRNFSDFPTIRKKPWTLLEYMNFLGYKEALYFFRIKMGSSFDKNNIESIT